MGIQTEIEFKLAIDRPGNGRDEVVSVSVNVAYRIRPDLATLQSNHAGPHTAAALAALGVVPPASPRASACGRDGPRVPRA